jgi:ferrous iron transport protein B
MKGGLKMALTNQISEVGIRLRTQKDDKIIALAGNPNVGKSTVFNHLTGLRQHTGNWSGKTVTTASGKYTYQNQSFIMVDIPGTYSLMANSVEEEVARDFICFGNPDATIVVTDATCLLRNLYIVLQTLEITSNVVVCVNLLDEAQRKKIHVNLKTLSKKLGVPVIGTSARSGTGLFDLMKTVYDLTQQQKPPTSLKITYSDTIEEALSEIEPHLSDLLQGKLPTRWVALKLLEEDDPLLYSIERFLNIDFSTHTPLMETIIKAKEILLKEGLCKERLCDDVSTHLNHVAKAIFQGSVIHEKSEYQMFDRRIDAILTSKIWGIPIMMLMLAFIFYLTITFSNAPSELISSFLFMIEDQLTLFFTYISAPKWLHGLLVQGVYRTLAWVVSVMLPPMAIFFPLFTLLEDLGYLPRVAFNLDYFFKKACAHGKQALTMCMGFGCNAAGIIGCRIIDSKRERLIAMITNNFVPCNGRFPTLIAMILMFFASSVPVPFQSIFSTLLLTGVILFGVGMTFLISALLSKTILKGLPSTFTLELPPYRKPQVLKVLIRSILDRTLFVFGRAVLVAIPAGLVIFGMANLEMGGQTILTHCALFLDPFARWLGLDGYILMAFILGFPANEIVVPILMMSYMASGSMMEVESLTELKAMLVSHGFTPVTALCMMLFSLMHWPCSTTCWTIKKESQSFGWTLLSFLIPTLTGIIICFLVANTARLMGFH